MTKTVSLLSFILFFATFCFAQRADKTRPNILLIMADQLQADALSCSGNEFLNTPNIDRIADGGIRFEKAYVTFPLCVPSRSSIITGKMPHEVGIYSNKPGQKELSTEDKAQSLGNIMEKAGYDNAYAGKWHAHEASMVDGYGFESIAPFGDIGLAEACVDFLQDKKDTAAPFFLVASFDNPHNICEWARDMPLPYGEVKQVPLAMTPELPKNFSIGPFEPEVLRLEQKADPRVYPGQFYQQEHWRHYRYTYYRLVEKMDAEVGKILDALDNLGLSDNTVIIFTSDHGDGNAAHQWNQKTALFEETVKVPFIISDPNSKSKISSSSELISVGLDLMPTIYDFANIKSPYELLGKSVKSIASTKKAESEREFVVSETLFDGQNAHKTHGRTVIGVKYKYVVYGWGKHREQLFDLENDPGEMVNLANSEKYKDILDKYRKHLYDWSETTNDTQFFNKLIIPDGMDTPNGLRNKPDH